MWFGVKIKIGFVFYMQKLYLNVKLPGSNNFYINKYIR